MADREERQLMRQRGAGARDVDEFSLSLGGLSSSRATSPDNASVTRGPVLVPLANENERRQERFLMRQRGAGGRDVDFSMNLGIPPASSPTGRVSVAGSTLSSNSQRRPASANSTPVTVRTRMQTAPNTVDAPAEYATTIISRKNGSFAEDVQLDDQEAIFYEDDDGLEIVSEDNLVVDEGPDSANVSLNGSTGSTTSSRKKRKKKSVLIKSKRRKTTSTGSVERSSVAAEGEGDTTTVTLPSTTKTGRKSPKQSSNGRKSIPSTSARPARTPEGKEDTLITIATVPAEEREPIPEPSPAGTSGILNRAVRPAVPAIPRIQREHGVRTTDKQSVTVANRPKPRARSKDAAPETVRRKKAGKSGTARRGQEPNKTVQITVHRLKHASQLDFISKEDDEHAIGQLSAFSKRKSANSLEILSQTCLEIVERRLTALSEQNNAKPERNITTNQRVRLEAVRSFGEELESRLMIMTTALEHNLSLQKNLKAALAAKATHRETLLDLRKQRSDIELQQDAVRAANERASKNASERFELNSLLADIQLAVQRGREGESGNADGDGDGDGEGHADGDEDMDDEDQAQGLAMRLQRIGEVVSSADGRVGLLDRVRALNGLLEGVLKDADL